MGGSYSDPCEGHYRPVPPVEESSKSLSSRVGRPADLGQNPGYPCQIECLPRLETVAQSCF